MTLWRMRKDGSKPRVVEVRPRVTGGVAALHMLVGFACLCLLDVSQVNHNSHIIPVIRASGHPIQSATASLLS
jgi:hypothetical protein